MISPKKTNNPAVEALNKIIDEKISKHSIGEGVFIEIPVNFSVFCKDFLNQPIHDTKLEVIDAILGKNPLEWDTKYIESLLLWGKGCFTGDTKISLLDGRELTFEELLSEFENKKENYTYSLDLNEGIKSGKIINCQITKEIDELIEIILDNNEIIQCTKEHLFLLKTGEYREAQNLKEFDSLMPLYREIDNNSLIGYEILIDPILNKNFYTHRKIVGKIFKRGIVHHKDYNKRNNNLTNLEVVTKNKHNDIHFLVNQGDKSIKALKVLHQKYKDNPEFKKEVYSKIKKSLQSDVIRKKISDGVKKAMNNGLREKLRNAAIRTNAISHLIKGSKDWYEKNKNNPVFIKWKKERAKKCNEARWNHKVLSIKLIKLENKIKVYDIEVENYSNFALSSGVFVHNSGKDFITSRLLAYIGYWIKCLRNPQRYFGIAEGTPIDFANVSINGTQAKEVFFKEFVSTLKRTINPKTGKNWFAEHGMDLRDDQDIQKRKVIFSPEGENNITAYSLDSERYTGEGKNLLVVVFDEVGAFRVSKAKELHTNIQDTQTSRFPKYRKMILISYLYDENDFMQIRWKETASDKDVYHSGPKATWEMNPYRKREDFKKKYEKDPEGAERIYECKGGAERKNRYFKFKEKIREFINPIRSCPIIEEALTYYDDELRTTGLKEWFYGGITEELYIIAQKIKIMNQEDNEEEFNKLVQRYNNIRDTHQGAIYGVHVDLAKGARGDCAGLTLGHFYPILNPFLEGEQERGFYIDLKIQLKTKNIEGEIKFENIRQFIYKLIDERNFDIKVVTFDGWQSLDSIQQMNARGIESYVLSVDKDTKAYDLLKEYLYKNTEKKRYLDYYHYNVFLRELEELRFEGGKIDHPEISMKRDAEEGDERGSKDVSDSAAGCCLALLEKKAIGEGSFVDIRTEEDDDKDD